MVAQVHIYDPLAHDAQSAVRGIGRYMKLLRTIFTSNHSLGNPDYTPLEMSGAFVADIKEIPAQSIFVQPFFNPIQRPLKIGRIAPKQIAVIHDLIPMKYPAHFPIGLRGWWHTLLNKWAIKKFDVVVTDSEASKQDIVKLMKIPAQKIHVIYPCVDSTYLPHLDLHSESVEHHHPFHLEQMRETAEFSPVTIDKMINDPKLATLPEFILYVGDVTWNKNLLTLAKAVQIANVPCVCVGNAFNAIQTQAMTKPPNPWMRPFYEFMTNVKQNPLFIFPGFVSDTQLLALYRKAKVNVLISEDEGFGLSYLESAYCGTPSVLSDIPVFREIAGKAALFADPHNPKDIATKIATLFYDHAASEQMSILAFDRAQHFHPDQFKGKWYGLIHDLQR